MSDQSASISPRSTTGVEIDPEPSQRGLPVPTSTNGAGSQNGSNGQSGGQSASGGKPGRSWLRSLLFGKSENGFRETLEEMIEDGAEDEPTEESFSDHEKVLLQNVLKLKDITAYDVMVPRADIVAISVDTDPDEVLQTLASKAHSRVPVYADTLDDVVGVVHVKDALANMAAGKPLVLREMLRDVAIFAPSMPVADLLLQMRESRQHLGLVVDEYGGIDGLVTIEDAMEQIVGEIEDEHSQGDQHELLRQTDGSWLADAKVELSSFSEETGLEVALDEDEDIDTLGGLVFSLAQRIPARGELIRHEDARLEFQIIDADPRRIRRLRVRPTVPPGE